jgi:hypothetical protein
VPSRTNALASLATTLTAAALLAGAPGANASTATTLPHIKGSIYCGKIYKADDYTIYTYAKSLSCESANSFSHACAATPGLHGWKVTSTTSKFGILLRKGAATIDLEIAGGSPPCLEKTAG